MLELIPISTPEHFGNVVNQMAAIREVDYALQNMSTAMTNLKTMWDSIGADKELRDATLRLVDSQPGLPALTEFVEQHLNVRPRR
jgi:hypothetical protein